jgi:hypothetical protein
MPFSYLNWEKYFIPAIPLAALRILLFTEPQLSESHGEEKTSSPVTMVDLRE